ncbi:DUF6335 family protein [Candidatus Nitrospira bockiana]
MARKKNTKQNEDKDVRDANEVIRDYYEGDASVEAEANEEVKGEFQEAQRVRGAETRRGAPADYEPGATEVSGGDLDARWDREDIGDETVGGSHALPDQDVVEKLGEAVGLTFQDTEPLGAGRKLEERDTNRWELNPASSEDYQERRQFEASGEPPEQASGGESGTERKAG